MTEHPITPPPELVQEWLEDSPEDDEFGIAGYIATQAARWGADQELEACCEYLARCAAWEPEDVKEFCDLRRPKPLSLKEQAKQALGRFFANEHTQASQMTWDFEIIRRAVESLPD
jgi:hypothetical protein